MNLAGRLQWYLIRLGGFPQLPPPWPWSAMRSYKFISRATLIMALVLFICLAWTIKAFAADPCWERHTYSIRFDTLGVTAARQLKGDELVAARRWVNSQPPTTDIEWETILLVDLPGGAGLILIGRESDRACIRMAVPAEHWLRVRLQMLGLPV
jgi:hypothetical protein